jgi:hypothetical protein
VVQPKVEECDAPKTDACRDPKDDQDEPGELACGDFTFGPPGECPDLGCEGKTFTADELPEMKGGCIRDLNLDHSTLNGDLHFYDMNVDKLSLRGATVNAITLENSAVTTVELESAEVKGTFAIESSFVDTVEISHSKLHVLEIRSRDCSTSHVVNLKMTNVDVGFIIVELSKIDDLDLTRVHAAQIQLDHSEIQLEHSEGEKKGELIDTFTQRLSVGCSKGSLSLESSTIQQFDLGNRTAKQVNWTGGQLGALEHAAGVDGLLANLRGQGKHNKAAFTALERDLRDKGEPFDANRVHIQALANEVHIQELENKGISWRGRARLLYLDGHGNPLAYLALFAALVSLGASFFSRSDGEDKAPDHVEPVDGPTPKGEPTQEKDGSIASATTSKAKGQEQQRPAQYSALVMSLATLLPGDTLNYLRNFKFVPRKRWQAVGVTILQLVMLGVQGLLLASILSLLGR